MDTLKYETNSLELIINVLLPLMFYFSLMMPILVIAYQMAEEKEYKLKAMIKMMGLKESTYNMAWYLIYTLAITIIELILLIILRFTVFKNSNFGIILAFFFVFGSANFGLILIFVYAYLVLYFIGLLATM